MSFISPDILVENFKMSNEACGSVLSGTIGNLLKSGKVTEERAAIEMAGKQSYAQSLYKKYESYIGDLPDGPRKRITAILFENWSRATRYLTEETTSTAIANWDKNAFPIIRSILPNLASDQAFTIQEMLGPTANIFTFQPVYGTTTGKVTAGDPLFGTTVDPYYGNSTIDEENHGTGDGATSAYAFSLDYTPIVAGSVIITDGTQVLSDNGSGVLVGDGSGTVNYTTGAVSLTFTAPPTLSAAINADYQVDNEVGDNLPEVDYELTSTLVTARLKAIKFRYSLVSEFALKAQYGLEGQAELNSATAAEIAYGIDIENFTVVVKNAADKTADTDFQFDETPGTGVSYTEHKLHLLDYMIKGSTYVAEISGRVAANWVLADQYVTNILESIGAPRFVKAPGVNAARGIQTIGTLDDRWTIFRTLNPTQVGMTARQYLLGSKQPEFLYAGYVFAPWILAFETPLTVLDDLRARKAIASLYGHKLINGNYYLKMKTIKS